MRVISRKSWRLADRHYTGATIYCSGLSPLLYLCCSGLFKDSEVVFIYFENTNKMGKKRNTEFYLSASKKIAQLFGHTITFRGPLKMDNKEFGADFSGAYFEQLNVDIKDGDFITKNLSQTLEKAAKNKKVSLLPEGASCYSPFYEAMDPQLFIGSAGVDGAIRRFIDKLSLANGRMGLFVRRMVCAIKSARLKKRLGEFENVFLLPVRSSRRLFYLEKFKNVRIFPEDIFYHNLAYAANRFADWFPEADYRSLESPFFHPSLMGFNDCEYAEYSQKIGQQISDRAILVKDHPAMLRSRSEMFKEFNLVTVPEMLRDVPGELFFFQANFTYVGYASTMLLFVDEERRVILEPDSNLRREVYGRKFDVILHLVGAESLIKRPIHTLVLAN